MKKLKIASRKSILALKQTQIVIDKIKEKYSDIEIEIVKVETKGDKNLENKLSQIGSKGLFTEEIERMLIDKSVDMAVHSLKDMPTYLDEKLKIGAYIKRDSHKDIIIFNKNYKKIEDLPKNAKIGTSSTRREQQLKEINPHLEISNIRGNIHTRIKKMIDEKFDAIILAKAGLQRLDMLKNVCYQDLKIVSAVGQGCICVEVCANNEINEILEYLNDEETMNCVNEERSFLSQMGGGCHEPMGAYCYKEDDIYKMVAYYSDGKNSIKKNVTRKSYVGMGKDIAIDIKSTRK